MMKAKLLNYILAVVFATPLMAQEDTVSFSSPQKLSDQINSYAEEGLPVMTADRTKLYFSRTFHSGNSGGKGSGQDVWSSQLKDGLYMDAENIGSLNDEWSNALIGVSENGSKVYLMNKRDEKGLPIPGISVAEFDEVENKWGEPVGLEIPGLDVNGTFYSASVASDESFILWTLPTAENEASGNDLYVSIKQGDSFSSPQSLGAAINTTENEISPFFDTTTGLLFFSTNGRGTPDDYDIYYAKKMGDEWDNWSMPVKAGINSTEFDAYFFMASDSSAYFASSRNDSISNLYVTQVVIESSQEESELVEEVPADTVETEIAEEPKTLRDPVLIIEINGEETKERSIESLSREELLDENTVIRFVYFEYDKFNITAKYVEVLDDVAGILDKYQDVIVTINGHTDAVASDGYNQVLSQNRAASTKEWLVINGVIPDRIKTAGYGEREPYASNMTEEGRSLNRRVEIFFSTE